MSQRARAGAARSVALACAGVVVACLLALLALMPAPAGAAGRAPWARRVTGYLAAQDGTKLRYSVLLPRARGRFPVVMNYSGYDAGSIGGRSYRRGETAMSPQLDAQLLRAGYAVLGVNMRGTGCSAGGAFRLFDRTWGTDGRDAVEWAARQRWSSGRIGMANWSYAGLSQLFTAVERPKHLRAIAPGMVVADPQRDVGALGGVPNVLFPSGWWIFINTTWSWAQATAEAEGDRRCVANIADHRAKSVKTSPPAMQELHPYYDAFGEQRALWRRTHRIDVPVLSMEAWQDESTGVRGGHYQRTLDPRRTWYVGTNGLHNVYVSRRFRTQLVKFFDRFVKGRANGFDRTPRVQLWQEATAPGAPLPSFGQQQRAEPGWVVTAPRLPVPVTPVRLWLRPGGTLGGEAPAAGGPADAAGPTAYAYPHSSPTVNAGAFGGQDRWESKAPPAPGGVAFTTPPLTSDLVFFGPASADLWISSTATDTDLQVTVTEVRPDGQEQYVQRGWLRASQRAVDERLSSELLPIHPQSEASISPLTPETPVLARVEIQKFSHAFRAGSSIRIWIDTPSTTGQEGFRAILTPATNRIWHDAAHPSRLVLGQLAGESARRPLSPCDSLIAQPCRPNPLAVPAG